jgi:hypothetical protein
VLLSRWSLALQEGGGAAAATAGGLGQGAGRPRLAVRPRLGIGRLQPRPDRGAAGRSGPGGQRVPLGAACRRLRLGVQLRGGVAAGDLLSGTTEEKARAMEGFVAYAGRYSFLGDRVIHHVEVSLFPNWVGSDQERWVELAGDRLTLSASPLLLAGKQQVPRLVWERVDRPPKPDRPLPGRLNGS